MTERIKLTEEDIVHDEFEDGKNPHHLLVFVVGSQRDQLKQQILDDGDKVEKLEDSLNQIGFLYKKLEKIKTLKDSKITLTGRVCHKCKGDIKPQDFVYAKDPDTIWCVYCLEKAADQNQHNLEKIEKEIDRFREYRPENFIKDEMDKLKEILKEDKK